MVYIYQLKHKEISNDKGKWLCELKIINFEIIHYKCRGDSLQNGIKTYKTVTFKNHDKCPESGTLVKIQWISRTDRKDLYLEKKIPTKF